MDSDGGDGARWMRRPRCQGLEGGGETASTAARRNGRSVGRRGIGVCNPESELLPEPGSGGSEGGSVESAGSSGSAASELSTV